MTKQVPWHPAYCVFHDAYDNGAMDVYPAESFELAKKTADWNQSRLEALGYDDCGFWRAYTVLPSQCKVYKFHPYPTGAAS